MRAIICLFLLIFPIILTAQLLEVEPNGYFLGPTSSGVQEVVIGLECQGYLPCDCPPEDQDCCDPVESDYWELPNDIEGLHTIFYVGGSPVFHSLKIISYPNETSHTGTVLSSLVGADTVTIDFAANQIYRIKSETHGGGNAYSFTNDVPPPLPHISSNAPMYIGSTNEEPDSSAILELESTTKGFLPPRMTEEEILAIENPAEGLMVYSTTEHVPLYFDNVWKDFGGNPRIFQQGDFRFGGIILSVNHFGEVIVLDTSFLYSPDTVAWGCDGVDIPLIEDLYNGPYNLGATNSQIISDSCGTTATATNIALNHVVESDGVVYNDWHLPTLVSGNYLIPQYANSSSIEYWLAHQEDANNAVITDEYSQTFSEPKTSEKRLILIRTFKYSQ